jgi:hypothetical protein
MTPSPDVRVCLDCGWSEFSIPRSWLSAGWLRPMRAQAAPPSSSAPSVSSLGQANATALSN